MRLQRKLHIYWLWVMFHIVFFELPTSWDSLTSGNTSTYRNSAMLGAQKFSNARATHCQSAGLRRLTLSVSRARATHTVREHILCKPLSQVGEGDTGGRERHTKPIGPERHTLSVSHPDQGDMYCQSAEPGQHTQPVSRRVRHYLPRFVRATNFPASSAISKCRSMQ